MSNNKLIAFLFAYGVSDVDADANGITNIHRLLNSTNRGDGEGTRSDRNNGSGGRLETYKQKV